MLTVKDKIKIYTRNKKFLSGITIMFFLSLILTVIETIRESKLESYF